MLKKLGIAAACGVALYGLAKLLSRHVVVVLDSTATSGIETMANNGTGQIVGEQRDTLVDDAASALPVGEAASQLAGQARETSWP